ncbi:MAG: transposase [Candidatus Methylomirabilales bacterium]
MPRPPRYPLIGVPQHVIQRGNNRQPTFFIEDDFRFYLECLKEAATTHPCEIHAYVLMTNHVHLLMTPRRANAIAKVIQSLGRRYVQYINSTYQRSGTLWEGRYKASVVESETYVLLCSRYIELNPVRSKLVADPAEYPWSSYHWHALGTSDPVITDHAAYLALGSTDEERHEAYRGLFRDQFNPARLQEIRESLNQCRVLGSERFKDEIEAVLSRRVRPGKVGRPKTNVEPKAEIPV